MTSQMFDERIGAVLRRVSLLGISSLLSGLIVGGFLGRVAMRVSAVAAGPEVIGDLTANGNRIGDLTVAGTLTLIVFVGGLGGLTASVLVVGADPWLAWTGPLRGLGFGLVTLAIAGGGDPFDSTDFQRLDPTALNVAMFVGLFLVFGIVVDILFRILDRRATGATVTHQVIYLVIASAGVIPIAVLIGLFTVPGFCGCEPDYVRLGVILTMLLATLAHYLAGTVWTVPTWVKRVIDKIGYGALLVFLVFGLSQTTRQISEVLGL